MTLTFCSVYICQLCGSDWVWSIFKRERENSSTRHKGGQPGTSRFHGCEILQLHVVDFLGMQPGFFRLYSFLEWFLHSVNLCAGSSSCFSCSKHIAAPKYGHDMFFRQDLMSLINPQDFILIMQRPYVTLLLNSIGPRSLRSPLICPVHRKIGLIGIHPLMFSFPSFRNRTEQ